MAILWLFLASWWWWQPSRCPQVGSWVCGGRCRYAQTNTAIKRQFLKTVENSVVKHFHSEPVTVSKPWMVFGSPWSRQWRSIWPRNSKAHQFRPDGTWSQGEIGWLPKQFCLQSSWRNREQASPQSRLRRPSTWHGAEEKTQKEVAQRPKNVKNRAVNFAKRY